MNRIDSLSKKKHVYMFYLIPFLILSLYYIVILVSRGPHPANGYYLIHYLYTYTQGFIPRGLVGEILSLFFDKINDTVTANVLVFFSCLLIISASLCIGKVLSKAEYSPEALKATAIIVFIICASPYSFRTYFDDMKLDKLLWALALFAMFLLDTKVGSWFVPLICMIATLVNPVFLFCSMLMVSIAMLYICIDTKMSKKWMILCAAAYASMIAIGIFGTISEKHLPFENAEEMIRFYFLRYDGVLSEHTLQFMARECMIDYFLPLKEFIRAAYQYYCIEWENGLSTAFNFVFVSGPAYILLSCFWIYTIKAEKNKALKFVFLLCLISPLVQVVPLLMSWEGSKYFGNNIMVHLCLIVFFLVQKNEALLQTLRILAKKTRENPLMATASIVYAGMFIFSRT